MPFSYFIGLLCALSAALLTQILTCTKAESETDRRPLFARARFHCYAPPPRAPRQNCTCFEGYSGKDCAHKEPFRTPTSLSAKIVIVWGLEDPIAAKDEGKPIWGEGRSSLALPETQNALYDFCKQLKEMSYDREKRLLLGLRPDGEGISCFIEELRSFALEAPGVTGGFPIESPVFEQVLSAFLHQNPRRASDVGYDEYFPNSTVLWAKMDVTTNIAVQTPASVSETYFRAWNDILKTNAEKWKVDRGFQTSVLWLTMRLELSVVGGIFKSECRGCGGGIVQADK